MVLAPRFPRLADVRVRLRLMLVASGAYGAGLALLVWQALRGQPLTAPDGVTLTATALLVVVAAAGSRAALRTRASARTGSGAPHQGATRAQARPRVQAAAGPSDRVSGVGSRPGTADRAMDAPAGAAASGCAPC
ncbi:hypothetical protein [Streptomyces sp. NPDC047928]|uniref:hypothetical protein n=1 Tax=unclassified Streptomyces TaxID=2593676 RepID=UPI00371184BA